jgi:hypothetical protein
VRFRNGEVTWEDAYSSTRNDLPDFETMRTGQEYVGAKFVSNGLVGKIGAYILVITSANTAEGKYDYTLIPCKAKVQIQYHGGS